MRSQDRGVQFKEIEVTNLWVSQEVAEARDVDRAVAVQVKVASQLIVHSVANHDSLFVFHFLS